MKERPILFSGPMIKALLAGKKTVTRRIVKNGRFTPFCKETAGERVNGGYPGPNWYHLGKLLCDWPLSFLEGYDREAAVARFELQCAVDDTRYTPIACPYGKPGDRLWVRESMYLRDCDDCGPWRYSADNEIVTVSPDNESAMLVWAHHKETCHCPSIHMHRWASRILLEITDIQPQRLQDMTEDDARKEGIETVWPLNPDVGHFVKLWDSINGKNYPWESNPYVWAISFKVLSTGKDSPP